MAPQDERVPIYNIDQELTNLLGLRDLFASGKRRGDRCEEIECWYDPKHMACDRGCDDNVWLDGFYEHVRSVYHVLPGNPPQIVLLRIHSRKFKCSRCKRSIQYEIDFAPRGRKTTTYLDACIAREYTNRSPARVASLFNGIISSAQAKLIFLREAEKTAREYSSNLAAPILLGAHKIKTKNGAFIVLSDLQHKLIMDLFPVSGLTQLSSMLLALQQVERLDDCVEDVSPETVFASRALVGSKADSTRAAIVSVYHNWTAALIAIACEHYENKRLADLKHYLSTPLKHKIPEKDGKKVDRLLKNDRIGLKQGIECWGKLRIRLITENWTYAQFDDCYQAISTFPVYKSFVTELEAAKSEIRKADIKKHLQKFYNDMDERIRVVVGKCGTCTPEIMRYRVLMNCVPQQERIRTDHGFRMCYAGFSLHDVANCLVDDVK